MYFGFVTQAGLVHVCVTGSSLPNIKLLNILEGVNGLAGFNAVGSDGKLSAKYTLQFLQLNCCPLQTVLLVLRPLVTALTKVVFGGNTSTIKVLVETLGP